VKLQSNLTIGADHPAFAGHFPGFPLLPGAVLLDEILRAVELAHGIDLKAWHVSSAKFLSAVRPGDSLVLEHEATSAASMRFCVRVDGRNVVSGTLHES
jgi:3-hydroxyacyl-[acyl-carrier-protein] dehydratase